MKTLTQLIKESTPKINEFVVLKPGFLQYEDDFCNLLKNNGWEIIQKQKKALSPGQIQKLYGKLSNKPFYNSLCAYMTSEPCLCCTCSKSCSDPIKDMCDLKQKVRAQWGKDDMKNAMHCSDSEEAVISESKCCMENIYESVIDDIMSLNNQDSNLNEYDYKTTLISLLQTAIAEEINAWYQYTIVAPFLHGKERKNIEEFYKKCATDELEDHAYWLINRINELGGTPNEILDLYRNNELENVHKFIIPDSDFDIKKSLIQNIDAERGAIETYTYIEKYTRDTDPVTNQKIKSILGDEQEHLTELQDFLTDIS